MKNYSLITLLLISGTLFAQNINNVFNSKSGKISYKLELDGAFMEYTLVFDQYGKKQAFNTKSTENGIPEKSKTIITPEYIYLVNYTEEQVIKMPTDMNEGSGENENYGGIDMGQIVNDVTGVEQQKAGSETLLGKSCEVYIITEDEGGKGKYWIWKDFLIKAEFIDESRKHSFINATEISLDINIDKSEFDVPEGFEITDMGTMMQQMQQMYQMPENE